MRAAFRVSGAGLLMLMLTASGSADTFNLGGHTVMLEPPNGFCPLDPDRPKEAAIIALNEQMQQPRNRAILQFADCDELASFRGGQRPGFERYGQYFTPQSREARKLVAGQTRVTYLAAAAQELPKVDSRMLADELTNKFTATGSEVSGARSLGVLGQDAAAIYLGIAFGSVTVGKKTVATSAMGVVGLTLVNDTAISLGLYQVNVGADSVHDLLETVQEQMAALVKANAAIEAREQRFLWHGLNLAEIARQAFYVAMLGLASALIGWLWLRISLRHRR